MLLRVLAVQDLQTHILAHLLLMRVVVAAAAEQLVAVLVALVAQAVVALVVITTQTALLELQTVAAVEVEVDHRWVPQLHQAQAALAL